MTGRWPKSIVIFFFLLTTPHFLQCQSSFQIAYAESLASTKQFASAVTEFKRFIFFNPRDNEVHRALTGLGNCYREEGEYDQALSYFQNSLAYAREDSAYDAASLEIALTYLQAGALDSGLLEVERILISNSTSSLIKRTLFVKFLALVKKHNWDDALSAFHQYIQHDPSILSDSARFVIQTALIDARSSSAFSSEKAQWLSTFLPGLGQLYAGDLKNGLNALALNAMLGCFVVSLLQSHAYFDGFTLFTGAFLRYYLGSRFRAGLIANERNENTAQETELRILLPLRELDK